jgi:hypothetical protein
VARIAIKSGPLMSGDEVDALIAYAGNVAIVL